MKARALLASLAWVSLSSLVGACGSSSGTDAPDSSVSDGDVPTPDAQGTDAPGSDGAADATGPDAARDGGVDAAPPDPCTEDVTIGAGETSAASCILEPGSLELGTFVEVFGTTNSSIFGGRRVYYQFTVSFWTRALALGTGANANTIVSQNHHDAPELRPLGNDSFRLRWASETTLELAAANRNQTGLETVTIGGLDAFSWNHVVLVYDNGEDCLLVYVNGSRHMGVCPGGNYTPTDAPIFLGQGPYRADGFSGLIDEVTTWEVGLFEQAQILELYNEGLPSDPTAHSNSDWLTGYWRMGEMAAAGTVPDASSNDHDATVVPGEGEVRFVTFE